MERTDPQRKQKLLQELVQMLAETSLDQAREIRRLEAHNRSLENSIEFGFQVANTTNHGA